MKHMGIYYENVRCLYEFMAGLTLLVFLVMSTPIYFLVLLSLWKDDIKAQKGQVRILKLLFE